MKYNKSFEHRVTILKHVTNSESLSLTIGFIDLQFSGTVSPLKLAYIHSKKARGHIVHTAYFRYIPVVYVKPHLGYRSKFEYPTDDLALLNLISLHGYKICKHFNIIHM